MSLVAHWFVSNFEHLSLSSCMRTCLNRWATKGIIVGDRAITVSVRLLLKIRGRSKTTFTRFGIFWPPIPLHLHFLWYKSLQKVDFFWPPTPPPLANVVFERPLISFLHIQSVTRAHPCAMVVKGSWALKCNNHLREYRILFQFRNRIDFDLIVWPQVVSKLKLFNSFNNLWPKLLKFQLIFWKSNFILEIPKLFGPDQKQGIGGQKLDFFEQLHRNSNQEHNEICKMTSWEMTF